METDGQKMIPTQDECDAAFEFCLQDIGQWVAGGSADIFTPHVNHCYHIIWFMGGVGTHEVDFNVYPVTGDTLFFLSPGQIHAFGRDLEQQGVSIRFCEAFLGNESSLENVFLKYDLFNAFETLPYLHVGQEDRPVLMFLLGEMQRELSRRDAFGHKDYLQHLLHLFLISIQRSGNRDRGKRLCISCQPDRLFVQFRQQLEHHYKRLHTVQEYADLLHVSSKTLTRSVSEAAKTTPLKIINQRLALEARRLLQYSDKKVKEIGYHLGFDDPSNFIKFFKRQTGQMPSYYRAGRE